MAEDTWKNYKEKKHSKPLPLKGIRVLEVCTLLLGPSGPGILSRLGAEVIKKKPALKGYAAQPVEPWRAAATKTKLSQRIPEYMQEQAPTSGALVWDQMMVAPEEIDRLGSGPEEVGLTASTESKASWMIRFPQQPGVTLSADDRVFADHELSFDQLLPEKSNLRCKSLGKWRTTLDEEIFVTGTVSLPTRDLCQHSLSKCDSLSG